MFSGIFYFIFKTTETLGLCKNLNFQLKGVIAFKFYVDSCVHKLKMENRHITLSNRTVYVRKLLDTKNF